MMYRIIIDFDADDEAQAEDAVNVVKATLPYVVDNISIDMLDLDADDIECAKCLHTPHAGECEARLYDALGTMYGWCGCMSKEVA